MKNLKFIALLFTSTFFLTSCSSDDDGNEPINEEEVITTVKVALSGGSTPITLEWKQLDESTVPEITGGTLEPNTTYTGTISILNELENPADNITLEIEEEADEHQFFYQVGSGLNISNLTYVDFDANGNPLGLIFSFDTGEASTGNFTITLRHDLNKNAAGVSDGQIANAGGETDVEVTFPLTIE